MTTSRAAGNATISQATRRPELSLFFDGDNATVRAFQYTDRFTLTGIPAASQVALQATNIVTYYGPNFDNKNPWLVVISF